MLFRSEAVRVLESPYGFTRLVSVFMGRRLQPLQSRPTPMWEYTGDADESRYGREDLPEAGDQSGTEAAVRGVIKGSKSKKLPSECSVDPFSIGLSLPEVIHVTLTFGQFALLSGVFSSRYQVASFFDIFRITCASNISLSCPRIPFLRTLRTKERMRTSSSFPLRPMMMMNNATRTMVLQDLLLGRWSTARRLDMTSTSRGQFFPREILRDLLRACLCLRSLLQWLLPRIGRAHV